MSYLKDYKDIHGKFIIICPLSIMKNWEREIKFLIIFLIITIICVLMFVKKNIQIANGWKKK